MEAKEEKAQQIYAEFQALNQHIKQLQKQLELITNQLVEMSVTNNSLDELDKIKVGKDIYVPISSGIFAKATIQDTSQLLVNVGANVVVKKDVTSTKKLIQKQIAEIREIQKRLLDELDKMTNHAAKLEMQLQNLISEG